MSAREKTNSENIEERIEEARKTGATTLSLKGLNLPSVPNAVFRLRALKTLDLSENQLADLPEEMGQLTMLRDLHLSDNLLTTLPKSLSNLSNVAFLDLQNNKFRKLPDCIFSLTTLITLLLNNNILEEIPEQLTKLSNLEHFHAWNNSIPKLPTNIHRMRSLRSISVWENRLTNLPISIGQLPNLETLELSSNNIQRLPESIKKLHSLERLLLHGNNRLQIPTEVLGPPLEDLYDNKAALPTPPSSILDYYFRTRSGSRPLNEAKLILVGRGSVGKTTLVHQLVHKCFVSKTKTKGIKVSQWKIPSTSGEITTHVWDFGGQEIMHGTHQFFLTERSLYLLVLAGRENREDEDAEYWLKTIRAFGGKSPVIVVLNKIKEHHFEIDQEGLKAKYPNIISFVETDCKPTHKQAKGYGILKLRKLVESEIPKMDSVRKAFPAAWFAIKQRLTSMSENFMSFDMFRNICDEHGERHGASQEELAHYLHLLGVALNYRDDPRLSETSVLNPKWVTAGIYKLLNDATTLKRRGVLKNSDLGRALNAKEYPPAMHEFLLRLMKKFELCFPLDDEGHDHLIPELLGKNQPILGSEFDIHKCLCFEYYYGNLLPEGLLPRFIVRAYTRIEKGFRWRTGVVLNWKGARALVKADEHDRLVFIRVHNKPSATGRKTNFDQPSYLPETRELLDLIRGHFDAIHRNFKQLDPVERVRVPTAPELLVDYAKLEVFAEISNGSFDEVYQGNLYHLDARQLLAMFEWPNAKRGSHFRGSARYPELALGIPLIQKRTVR